MTDNQIQSALNSISSLQLSVADLNTQVGSLSSQVQALGGTVTPQGQSITNTITSEASARASADDALATHVGALSCNPGSCRPISEGAATTATAALTTRVTSAEESTLEVFPGQAVETLRLGKVTFYGESARVIRDAQAVLESAGAGQLEVIKREPFKITADGHVYISEAVVGKAAIDPSLYRVKLDVNDQGRFFVAGVGLGVSTAAKGLKLGPSLEDDVRRLLREELRPGGLLHRS